jgi:hypothetical protein
MSAFYSVVKSLDKHMKFIFITGVSKFAKVSVFSGMNNLTDISMDSRYTALCGITEQELQCNFSEGIEDLIAVGQLSTAETLTKIK